MPRFVIRRSLGEVSLAEVEAAGRRSKEVREKDFPDIVWEHSHVVQTKDGMTTFCVYTGPSADRVRAHAAAAGLPADEIFDLVTDVDPAEL